ncbi:uncharacterized protein LOC141618735 [Silene latifolia]|uniref:uncharacterized protein LOC141618735 n=1 Tax=Silene latifolia TaxID=37657 RepID=UPI003D772A33
MEQIQLITYKNHSSSFISSLSKIFTLLAFLVLVHPSTTTALDSIERLGNETDHIALVSIKSQLIDHPNGVLQSWNNSVHHCNWEGVTCGRKHNRVTVIDLSSRGLTGTISPFIGNLSFLETISLSNNSLYGQIPKEVSHLLHLQTLLLYQNALSGEIPVNISSCVNLREFSIGYNKIEGNLPDKLGTLPKLEVLSIYKNNFTGPLFDIISNLTSLRVIVTYSNAFTGTIPNSIGRMRNLTSLNVGGNELSGIFPTSIFNLSSLEKIDLVNSRFQGELPSNIDVALPRLTWLNLYGNNFSGSIPINLLNLTNLVLLELGKNSFTGRVLQGFGNLYSLFFLGLSGNFLTGDINFINTLVNCSNLQVIDFRQSGFTGELPESIGNLSTGLQKLGLGQNRIDGTIPAGITNLISLVLLDMEACNFTGALPLNFGKLQNLQSIFLDSNKLTGRVPESLGNLSRLSEIYLQDNKLEGNIPQTLGNCQSLLYLNLSYNELNGTLDSELLTGSAKFVGLDLSHNNLVGSLPLEIGKQTSLGNIRLSKNKFSGVIPEGLAECSALQQLYMNGNSFHGDIPSSFTSLSSLQEIDFSQNSLSGPIPDFFTKFTLLHYLNLSYNDFEGQVPTNAVFANVSATFLVGNQGLCGGIPAFHLPQCTREKRRTMPRTLMLIILVISALVGVLVVGTGLYLMLFRKKKVPLSSDPIMGKTFIKVSYGMLLRATDGFSLENLLGSGSFGSVYKGTLDGNTVAVKVLNLQHRGASKSFMAECNALRNIRHRNLVGIITACSSTDYQKNDFKALVFEFMPKGSLDKWFDGSGNKSISLIHRVEIALDVAYALNYLHNECETPIVHRDLKPSNILLDTDMVAHVGDFGLAKFLTKPSPHNQYSTIGISGSIGYAAPEYGLGSEASVDGDVYSFGILVLELMTGKRPTDDMFKEDYNLHIYAKEALPDNVLQIVDPKLEYTEITEEADNGRAIQDVIDRRVECIVSMVSIGVACSQHSPQDRMKITDAIGSLRAARDNLLDTRK